ncbi:MAG: hypothetical protein EKK55_18990 [Rhodocyclaceae bacterium]|nr:MAG: hypothetical protein EKK55_18990 [Rhodocyclaceae bacterium]
MTAKPFRLPEPDNSMLAIARRLHRGCATIRMHAATGDRKQLQEAAREMEMLALHVLADARRREARGG